MLAGLWVLGDPSNLRSDQAVGDSFGPIGAAAVTFILGIAAVTSLAIWWYPRVELGSEVLTVRNPLRTVVIPRGHIQDVDSSGFLVRVQADGRSYRCAGLETSLAMTLSDNPNSSTNQVAAAVQPILNHDRNDPVQVAWRHPTALEVAVGSGWLVLAIVALIAAR